MRSSMRGSQEIRRQMKKHWARILRVIKTRVSKLLFLRLHQMKRNQSCRHQLNILQQIRSPRHFHQPLSHHQARLETPGPRPSLIVGGTSFQPHSKWSLLLQSWRTPPSPRFHKLQLQFQQMTHSCPRCFSSSERLVRPRKSLRFLFTLSIHQGQCMIFGLGWVSCFVPHVFYKYCT